MMIEDDAMLVDPDTVDPDMCDLCHRQRPGEARQAGVGWVDNFRVCGDCFRIYCRKLEASGRRRSRGTRS